MFTNRKNKKCENNNFATEGLLDVDPHTANQASFIEAIRGNTITFGVGPAGCGKTYLAVAEALRAYQAAEVDTILLFRPAVEMMGRKQGALPGSARSKVLGLMRSMLDIFDSLIGNEGTQAMLRIGSLQIVEESHIRGLTFNRSFVIFDEVQNAPKKLFVGIVHRLNNSKMVAIGDLEQVDLEDPASSCLVHLEKIAAKLSSVSYVRLSDTDQQRDKLAMDVVRTYDEVDGTV